jgi:hypothetical protein
LTSRWAKPRIPQLADDSQAVVDHAIGDLGLAELHRPIEELGDQQILPLRSELNEPERGRAWQAGALHQRQRVVLLLHQPPHGVERLLVLQPAVQQLPAQLVPAVGPQVALGVQLAEQHPGRITLDRDPQRGGAGRPGQPERFDLLDDQPELVLQPASDRLAAGAADVQVRAATSPVGDREDLAGREPAEGNQRDRDPDAGREEHVGGGVDAQRDAGDPDQRHQRDRHPLAGVAPAALGHQRVQNPNQQGRKESDRHGRQRPPAPAGLEVHSERPRPPGDHRQAHRDCDHELPGHPPHDQVPPAP